MCLAGHAEASLVWPVPIPRRLIEARRGLIKTCDDKNSPIRPRPYGEAHLTQAGRRTWCLRGGTNWWLGFKADNFRLKVHSPLQCCLRPGPRKFDQVLLFFIDFSECGKR